MPEPAVFKLTTEDDVHVELRRLAPARGDGSGADRPRKAVLLLHGASANHRTFTSGIPGLAAWLAEPDRNYDPWLLDWRGSSLVAEDNKQALKDGRSFTFNAAAAFDIRAALRTMHDHGVEFPIAAFGHCMGSAVLAEAVAMGQVESRDIDCLVLETLGLFYETPADRRIKSEERILERLQHEKVAGEFVVSLNPHVMAADGELSFPWARELENAYNAWPGGVFHVDQKELPEPEERRVVRHMCNRVAFMYGMPYQHDNLVDEIHGTDANPKASLPDQFGAIPLQMFINAAKNVRQGHATVCKGRDGVPDGFTTADFISSKARDRFRGLSKVTLITGALNRLWHRNSIDLMHAWLMRGRAPRECCIEKRIVPNYAHQDLLWGKSAATEVFPLIEAGLR